MTELYHTFRPRKGHSDSLPYGLAEHRAWCRAQRDPAGLEPSDEWFRRHPNAKVRIVGIAVSGGRWWNLLFIPRRGFPCELLAENMRDILAKRFPNGTPRERLLAVADWLRAGGCFPKVA